MMPARIAEERVKLYRDFKLDVALDDPIFGIAYYQGKAEQLLRRARDIGFTHCQIDTRQFERDDAAWQKKADDDSAKFSAIATDPASSCGAKSARKRRKATVPAPKRAPSTSKASSPK